MLWRIDPANGSHAAVDLAGVRLTNGDGLLLVANRTLQVVQNRLNQIVEVKLDKRRRSSRCSRAVRL